MAAHSGFLAALAALVSLAAPAAGYAQSAPTQRTHGPDPVTAGGAVARGYRGGRR